MNAVTYPVPAPALQFDITCPLCGADVILTNGGRFSSREVSAVVVCSECPANWSIRLDMVQIGISLSLPGEGPAHRPVAECGTDAGYRKHRREGQEPCEACKSGHAQDQSRWARQRVSA